MYAVGQEDYTPNSQGCYKTFEGGTFMVFTAFHLSVKLSYELWPCRLTVQVYKHATAKIFFFSNRDSFLPQKFCRIWCVNSFVVLGHYRYPCDINGHHHCNVYILALQDNPPKAVFQKYKEECCRGTKGGEGGKIDGNPRGAGEAYTIRVHSWRN